MKISYDNLWKISWLVKVVKSLKSYPLGDNEQVSGLHFLVFELKFPGQDEDACNASQTFL